MKILMIAPLSAGIVHGGVRMQSAKTLEYLRTRGHEVAAYNPWEHYEPESFDIIHLFLAGNETLTLAKNLRNRSTRFVLSPVFFTRRSASTIRNILSMEDIGSQLLKGFSSDYSIKADVCRSADLILPNTMDEANLIIDGFGVPIENVTVVPNGVENRFENASADPFIQKYGLKDFTLFVGDASAARKNVLPMLEQYGADDPPLVIIGALDESDYSSACRKLIKASDNIHYLGPINHDDPMLESAYKAAAVFVLPSLFETPGIAALEAGLAGCRIAITGLGGTREYFGDHAFYINPDKQESIIRAIRNAHQAEESPELKNRIKKQFTWQAVAEKTEAAYQSIL
ncbi:glycosyltransferase [Rhodohalobacter sp. SW132]|uniref:glycosyltransferase n=1 Tax=Rhodohalobacter sp. SW132 TaxID=2293433 RepID=UPI001314EBA5|nr:glycosyltransferase [Rhodohalobacter sp. SW132]